MDGAGVGVVGVGVGVVGVGFGDDGLGFGDDGFGLGDDGFGDGRSSDGSTVGLNGGGVTGRFPAGGDAEPDFDGLARTVGWADDEGAVPLGAELGPCVVVTDAPP
jgi:hypothetical protein